MESSAPTDHVPIISYILVSEFDILKGSTLKASYPSSIPNYKDNFFSNLMLPEGAHHHEEDTTIFFLHRQGPRLATTTKETAAAAAPPPPPRSTSTSENIPSDSHESLPTAAPVAAAAPPPPPSSRTRKVPPVRGALLKYDLTISDWIRLGGEREWLTFDVEERSTSSEQQQEQQEQQEQEQHDFVATSSFEERRRLKIHADLEYTKLSDTFASVYDEEDQAVGLLFKSTSDLSRFETLLRSVGGYDDMVEEETKAQRQEQAAMTISVKAMPAEVEEEAAEEENNTSTGTSATTTTATTEPPFLYCLNLVRTRKDNSVNRGAVVKAVAICSPYPFFQSLKKILIFCLDAIYQLDVDILPHLFRSMNETMLRSQMPPSSLLQRAVLRSTLLLSSASKVGGPVCEQTVHFRLDGYGGRKDDDDDDGGSSVKRSSSEQRAKVAFNHRTVPIVFPLYLEPDMAGDASLVALVQLFRWDVALIMDAVLHGRRVLFVRFCGVSLFFFCFFSSCFLISFSQQHAHVLLSCFFSFLLLLLLLS